MGMLSLPVLNQGSLFWNGIANGYVPILKWGFPFWNEEYWQPHSEMGIMLYFWLLVVCDSKDRKKYSPHSETGSPCSVMGRRQKNSKLGSPHSNKEFVLNWGLTYRLPTYFFPEHNEKLGESLMVQPSPLHCLTD